MNIHPLLTANHGFATRAQLRRDGVTAYELRRQLDQGRVIAIGRSLIARRDADPGFLRIARMGGRAACISAAAQRKLWVLHDGRLHVAPRVLNSHFAPDDARPPVKVHRTRHPIDHADLIPIESPLNMLMHVARCQPLERVVAVFDSGLNQKQFAIEELRMLASVHGGAFAQVMQLVSGLADSGLESLTRVRLHFAGIACREQVKLHGHRVDLLIGERLVVQLDGRQHLADPKQLIIDREYDRYLRRLGYTVVRFGYDDVVRDWPRAISEITALMAQRAHLWP